MRYPGDPSEKFKDSKGIAPLKKDGKLYSDTVDKANVLNQQF